MFIEVVIVFACLQKNLGEAQALFPAKSEETVLKTLEVSTQCGKGAKNIGILPNLRTKKHVVNALGRIGSTHHSRNI